MTKENESLHYVISETMLIQKVQGAGSQKSGILVVSFAGALDRACLPVLEQCQAEVVGKNPKWVVMVFRDVADRVELPAVSAIGRLEIVLRKLPTEIRLCGVHPSFKTL